MCYINTFDLTWLKEWHMIMCPPPQKVFSFARVPNERSIEVCRYLLDFRPPGCIRSISIQPSGGTRGVEVPACLLIVNDDGYLCPQAVVEALHLSVALGLRQCGPGLYHHPGFLGHIGLEVGSRINGKPPTFLQGHRGTRSNTTSPLGRCVWKTASLVATHQLECLVLLYQVINGAGNYWKVFSSCLLHEVTFTHVRRSRPTCLVAWNTSSLLAQGWQHTTHALPQPLLQTTSNESGKKI